MADTQLAEIKRLKQDLHTMTLLYFAAKAEAARAKMKTNLKHSLHSISADLDSEGDQPRWGLGDPLCAEYEDD